MESRRYASESEKKLYEDLAALSTEKLTEKIKHLITQLCKTGGRSFRMSIPVSPEDMDMLVLEACRRLDSSWTPVSERLPESDWVLAWVEDNSPGTTIAGRDGMGRWYNLEHTDLNVTHWRELPKPPEE